MGLIRKEFKFPICVVCGLDKLVPVSSSLGFTICKVHISEPCQSDLEDQRVWFL